MVERHKNAQLCNIANASKYNIPIFEDNIVENEIDFHNPDTILHYLKNYGWNLIDINNFNLLKSMFEKLPHGTIMSSQDLLLLASVVNCEMGNIIDADFFLKKSELFEEFDTEKIEIKLFTRFKIEFALGRNDLKSFWSILKNSKK
jgi:ATP/maltotriose-dependent transcriptional regulator MalT